MILCPNRNICGICIYARDWFPNRTHDHIASADFLYKNPVPILEDLPGIADILNLVIGCFSVKLDGKPAPAN